MMVRRALRSSWMLVVMLAACAGEPGPPTRDGNARPARPEIGVVESVKSIDMPDEQGASGYFLGGTLGNIGGAVIGSGRGSVAAAVLGGVAGATAGDAAQNNGVVAGQELWLKLEGRQEPMVVRQAVKLQGAFQAGERVRVGFDARGRAMVEHQAQEATPQNK
ncbi:hypothetical protein [Ferriphaselus sp. R-1]|uniref:outer membrane lipoprotein n=1 Tax=Ferriphaselus sp. R-1 TaxID=1485544 RepID=UPI001268D56B|nr:hypothetical protein [Ferriphaselus sp. R-1]